MIYLLVAIVNAIYGILLLLTLTRDTPGYFIVFAIGAILTILGISGFVLWLRMAIRVEKETPPNDTAIKSWFGLAKSFDIVLVLGLLFRAFVIQPYIVDGNSMEPNFHNSEILLVDKISYHFRSPQRGETIIFKAPPAPNEDYIKRIVGLPGDTVTLQQGSVYINGSQLNETYVEEKGSTYSTKNPEEIYRLTLKPNEYFVLGDNRQHSSDSREWGVLPKVNIIGRAFLEIYPFKQAGLIRNPKIKLPASPTQSLLLPNPQLVQNFRKTVQWQKITTRY